MSIYNAEQFLLKVIKRTDWFKSFDTLRFNSCNKLLSTELPPTSATIRLDILRAFYVTYQQKNLLNFCPKLLDPLQFGYSSEDERLVPRKINILFPPVNQLHPSCNCKKCSTNACPCRKTKKLCTPLCKCRVSGTCQNYSVNK